MPLTIACPSCAAAYQVPDAMLGKSVRCTRCNNVFNAEQSAAPVNLMPEQAMQSAPP